MQQCYRITFFALLTATSLLILGSCDKDEEVKPPDNHIFLLGKIYQINDVIIRYNGTLDLTDDDQTIHTHYMYTLFISDGNIPMSVSTPPYDASYIIATTIGKPIKGNKIDFTGGAFNGRSQQEFLAKDLSEEENFFSIFFIQIDVNGNHKFSSADNDVFTEGNEGQIVISMEGSQYKMTINNMIVDDNLPATPITGLYYGPFEVIQ